MLGQQREGRRHVFILHEDAFRRAEVNGRKVPNCEDPALDHRVANGLRLRGGHGDDADVNIHIAADARELAHRQYLLAGDLSAAEVRVYVKGGDDA